MIIPDFSVGLILQLILLLCGYKSFKAISADNEAGAKNWLTFWFCYTALSTAKFVLDIVYSAFSIPFYNEFLIVSTW